MNLENGWLPHGAGCRYGCGSYPRHADSCIYAEWRETGGFVHPYRNGACALHGTLYCTICTRRIEECIHGACREYATNGDYCPWSHAGSPGVRMTRRCQLCGATGVLQSIGAMTVCVRQSCQDCARTSVTSGSLRDRRLSLVRSPKG